MLSQVRSSDVSWSDTRRTLRKDHRWESGSLLEREEKEKLFNEHIEALTKKKREHFRQLLDETSAVRAVDVQIDYLCSPWDFSFSGFLSHSLIGLVLFPGPLCFITHFSSFITKFVHYVSLPVYLEFYLIEHTVNLHINF